MQRDSSGRHGVEVRRASDHPTVYSSSHSTMRFLTRCVTVVRRRAQRPFAVGFTVHEPLWKRCIGWVATALAVLLVGGLVVWAIVLMSQGAPGHEMGVSA